MTMIAGELVSQRDEAALNAKLWGREVRVIGCRDGRLRSRIKGVSTIQEIEAAIEQLPALERDAFESRLIARRLGLDDTTDQEYQALLASLDEADKEIDSGRGLSADTLRKRISGEPGGGLAVARSRL